MAKQISVRLSAKQARALVWAVNIFEASYEDYDQQGEEYYKDAHKAVRALQGVYQKCAEFAEENGE
jgi:hypothetical protein